HISHVAQADPVGCPQLDGQSHLPFVETWTRLESESDDDILPYGKIVACRSLRTPHFSPFKTHRAASRSRWKIPQIHGRIVALAQRQIPIDHIGGGAGIDHPTVLQMNGVSAKLGDRSHVMTHKKHGSSLFCHITHFAKTFLLERSVADGQHLVDHQNLRLQVRSHRKRQPHVHPARIVFYRRVEELLHVRPARAILRKQPRRKKVPHPVCDHVAQRSILRPSAASVSEEIPLSQVLGKNDNLGAHDPQPNGVWSVTQYCSVSNYVGK